jgi:hypothetical protein
MRPWVQSSKVGLATWLPDSHTLAPKRHTRRFIARTCLIQKRADTSFEMCGPGQQISMSRGMEGEMRLMPICRLRFGLAGSVPANPAGSVRSSVGRRAHDQRPARVRRPLGPHPDRFRSAFNHVPDALEHPGPIESTRIIHRPLAPRHRKPPATLTPCPVPAQDSTCLSRPTGCSTAISSHGRSPEPRLQPSLTNETGATSPRQPTVAGSLLT